MEISYNLRFQKFTFSNRVLIDKEGEIIVYDKGFRLKGKGASDKGELISFSDLKEFYYKDEQVFFITFSKEKYILSDASTLFPQLLKDLYRARNEFLVDALFMKCGKLKAEYEAYYERLSKFSKLISKSPCKIKIYDCSLVVVPENMDAFVVNFNFLNSYEFEDFEYKMKMVMDDGETIVFSQLGDYAELFQEKLDSTLSLMYQSIVDGVFKAAFPYINMATLLKAAYKIKGGKSISKKDLLKIDKELAQSFEDYIFETAELKESFAPLFDLVDDYDLYYGLAKDHTQEDSLIKWVMFNVPSKNIVAFSILPRWQEGDQTQSKPDIYFYRIIMEKGNPADKAADKIRELNYALLNLKFAKDPLYKDRKDLKHSPFQYAIRKMPFLRILRKSFLDLATANKTEKYEEQINKIFNSAKL